MLYIYSMKTHQVIKTLGISDVHSFLSNERFTAIVRFHYIIMIYPASNFYFQCTTTPPSIHILNSTTLSTLHIVSAGTLLPFVHPLSSISTNNKSNINNVSNVSVSTSPLETTLAQHGSRPNHPLPVFALSHRLIAFASAAPRPSSSAGSPSHPSPRARPISGTLGVNITQADIGNAALKVGGSVLSGMKALGGIAYSAAKARVAPTSPVDQNSVQEKGGLSNIFARNAPAASTRRISVPGSGNSTEGGEHQSPPEPVFAQEGSPPRSGYYVTVLDLASLLAQSARGTLKPIPVAEFVASRRYPISDIHFTADGSSLIISPSDGRLLRVLNIRPSAPATKFAAAARQEGNALAEATRMYDMRRGQTSAVVDGVEGSADGRWIAVGSRKRTIHVFAVNPYGGKADQRSHLEGRVRNVDEIVSRTVFQSIRG